jgi:integrase
MPKVISEPTYQLHKGSGQARTVINGKSIYLGKYNSPESQDRFNDIKAEWRSRQSAERYTLTIDNLCLRFLEHADEYYRQKDGTPTGTLGNFKQSLRPLIELYGQTRAREFGPLALKAFREKLIESGRARTYINNMVGKIKQVFRWGVAEELIPADVYNSLTHLTGLAVGRSKARESAPILPVDVGTVNDTLPHLPRIVADMVRLQLLTGARPGEVCSMRPCDVTRGTSGVWIYRPSSHKTEYRGRERRIFIGPEGQAILTQYLNRDSDSFCFSPLEAEAERNETRRANRKSPMTPSQAVRKPKGRPIRSCYKKDSYNRAVTRACEIACGMPDELRDVYRNVARLKDLALAERTAMKARLNHEAAEWRRKHCWSPNQLRHSRATAIRELYGIEAAQTVLGHADQKTTLIYAERDFEMAARIMKEIG